MAQLNERAAEDLEPAQAAELAEVIDLEARWENLRADRPGGAVGHGTVDLQNRQRTYEAFRCRWVAYTARYRTLRIPELTPNGPERLGAWCRTVRAVLRRTEGGGCPVHAVEKAYRLAGRIAERLKKEPVGRDGPLGSVGDAIREMDAVVRWCDGLLPPAEGAADEMGN